MTLLDSVQRRAFEYFRVHFDERTGLIADSTAPNQPTSIAGVGFALTCYPIAVERGWMQRTELASRTLTTLRFFDEADRTGAIDGTGYKGFFYHFLDTRTGKRAWRSELSTIDTAILVAGMLTAAQYFDARTNDEREIRERASAIYERVDWRWAQNGELSVTMGWKPESGFLRARWLGYNEALFLYILALGASAPVARGAYDAWTSTFRRRLIYGRDVIYAGPLFIHQFSHLWIDFRNIQDRAMRAMQSDYFINSQRATQIHREYATRNPRKYIGYDAFHWGLTASDGPTGYAARGAPYGPDDGTLSPWAAIASLPFAPEVVLATMDALDRTLDHTRSPYGFYASFNPQMRWISRWHFALHQGPIVTMIENHRTGLIWRLMRDHPAFIRGLSRAGFVHP